MSDLLTPSLLSGLEELMGQDGKISEYTVVRVRNNGTTPFVGKYARNKFVINPGQEGVLPYFAMVLYCGDPRAHDVPNDSRRKYRANEWKRLRVLYGVYDSGDLTSIPNLEVFTMAGQPITTVIQDPYDEQGQTTTKQTQVADKQINSLLGALEASQNNVKALEAMVDQLLKDRGKSRDTLQVPGDDPPEPLVLDDLPADIPANFPQPPSTTPTPPPTTPVILDEISGEGEEL